MSGVWKAWADDAAIDAKIVAAPPDEFAPVTFNIDEVDRFERLIPVAHSMALVKGWWKDGIHGRPVEEIVANYHADVSEAWEEFRCGRMTPWHAEGSSKPEGFWVEIVDLLIRLADVYGSGRFEFGRSQKSHDGHVDFPIAVVRLHDFIAEWKFDEVVAICEAMAKFYEIDLYHIVRLKLAYNAGRPYRHGNKLA